MKNLPTPTNSWLKIILEMARASGLSPKEFKTFAAELRDDPALLALISTELLGYIPPHHGHTKLPGTFALGGAKIYHGAAAASAADMGTAYTASRAGEGADSQCNPDGGQRLIDRLSFIEKLYALRNEQLRKDTDLRQRQLGDANAEETDNPAEKKARKLTPFNKAAG